MSLADELMAARMKHHVSFEQSGVSYAILAMSICKNRDQVTEIYEMAAIAIHIGVFKSSVEELAIKAVILLLANNLQACQGSHYAIAEAIKYDNQHPTTLVCTPL